MSEFDMKSTIHLIAARAYSTDVSAIKPLKIANNVDVDSLQAELASADVVELHFPKFSDGRAFSQAVQLRRRHGFLGDIRATGDVLVDQVLQMQRTGFSSAVLREDQNLAHAQKLLTHFSGFYQGDAALAQPRFAHA